MFICAASIVRIRWPKTVINYELWRLTKLEKIEEMIVKLDHTLRKPAYDIARQSLNWNAQRVVVEFGQRYVA